MKYLVIMLSLIVSSVIYANSRSGLVDMSDNKIQLIHDSASRLFVYNVEMADSTCDMTSTPVLFFSGNDISKEIYSMILAAKTSSRRVELIAGQCVAIAGNTYPSIHSVYME